MNFKKFLEELDIKGHSGIPGEGGKRPGESDYLASVTLRAKERLGIQGQREGDPRAIRGAVDVLMSRANELNRLCRGHEKELEKLATDIITNMYKPLIDAYEIKLDIKFATSSEMRREQEDTDFWDKSKVKEFGEAEKGKKPVIRARGLDFSMLIHESVKGIWFVLSSGAIPKDKKLAAEIKKAITYEDEPQDWRFGPEIASDLRDFVNENKKVDRFPNVREELWKVMCDEDTMPSEEFIELMRGILSKTPEARRKVDLLIDEIIVKLDKWHREWNEYQRQLAEWENWEKSQKDTPEEIEPQEVVDPYERMSKRELDSAIDRALDSQDYDLVSKLSEIKERKFGL